MKQLLSLLAFVLILATSEINSQSLSFSPEQAKPGTTITIKYNPTGTPLEGVAEFDAVAYLMKGDTPNAVELEMTKEGDTYTATVETDENTKALFIKLANDEKEKADNNSDNGYGIMFYGESGKPVQGAYGEMAKAFGTNSYFTKLEVDAKKQVQYWQKEFEMYPDSKSDNMVNYATASNKAEHKEGVMEAKEMIEELSKSDKEDDILKASSLYRALGNRAKYGELRKLALEKFPEGSVAKGNLINSFYKAKDVAGKIEVYESVKSKYGEDENIDATLSRYASGIALEYSKSDDWDNFDKYVALINTNQDKAGLFNNLAWGMSGESIEAEAPKKEMGKKLSAKSLKLVKADIENLEEVKPAYFTKKEYKKQLKYSYAMYADTYALLAFKTGEAKEALDYQKIACKVNKWESGEMNERYTVYFEESEGGAKTVAILEDFIKEGTATGKMKAQYKRLFMENYTMDIVYDKYIVELEKEALIKMKKELKKKMIDEPAPNFSLVNLDGKQVTLSEMKGKVVVVDFWATWCGPCKASFPGMQMAVNKYADNENVEFVFVDTWESAKEKEENARKFIESKEYTFNVLMDNEDKVVADYGVSGIPTKFVIGKDGKIRFRSSGFGGNDDELVKELSMMIDMAAAVSGKDLPGAP